MRVTQERRAQGSLRKIDHHHAIDLADRADSAPQGALVDVAERVQAALAGAVLHPLGGSAVASAALLPSPTAKVVTPPPALRLLDRPTGTTQWALEAVPPAPGRLTSPLVRVFDVVVALAGLVVLAPILLIVAATVRLTSPGPLLYGSPRLGSDKPRFKAWKFRSMYVDAEQRLARILETDPAAAAEYHQYRKLADDPRITPFGRFIRRTSLDELPQLVNILMGEMSVVGPRPKLPNEAQFYGRSLELVLSVRPGLTGLWQVSGRSNLSMSQRVALDVHYAKTRTLVSDLGICLRTFVQLWRPGKHGAW